jgi:hypothetical protein
VRGYGGDPRRPATRRGGAESVRGRRAERTVAVAVAERTREIPLAALALEASGPRRGRRPRRLAPLPPSGEEVLAFREGMQPSSTTSLPLARMLWAWFPLCVVVLAALVLAASGARATAAVGATIPFTCPSAPSDWTSSPAGPQFWGPDQNPGADTTRITCIYLNSKSQALTVAVNYADPDDLNPIDDFFYGCGTGSVGWSDTQRVYQVASDTHWVDANFSDPLNLFASGDVTKFEAVANQMVDNAKGLAHSCGLKVVPTDTLAGWLFDFEFDLNGNGVVAYGGIGTHIPPASKVAGIASYAIPDGSLQTKGPASARIVTKVSAPPVQIVVLAQGKKHTVTIRLTKGISFRSATTQNNSDTTSAFVTQIRVVHSTLSTCPVGSLGTLALATVPSVLTLKLCGSVFGSLKGRKPEVTITNN